MFFKQILRFIQTVVFNQAFEKLVQGLAAADNARRISKLILTKSKSFVDVATHGVAFDHEVAG